jgi:hypothetical protein
MRDGEMLQKGALRAPYYVLRISYFVPRNSLCLLGTKYKVQSTKYVSERSELT